MYSITRNGEKLHSSKYTIDLKNKVFEIDIFTGGFVDIDFTGLNGWTFMAGSYCAFKTGDDCFFDVGYSCYFETGSGCEFKTRSRCTFKVGSGCELVGHCLEAYRHNFLDKGYYVFDNDELIKIKDKNDAILNMKHENQYVRRLCRKMLKSP